MKVITTIVRILVGGLFIFSGFVKSNDPKGTAIKLDQYFDVFSNDFKKNQDSLIVTLSNDTNQFLKYSEVINPSDSFTNLNINQSSSYINVETFEALYEGEMYEFEDSVNNADLFVLLNNNQLLKQTFKLGDTIKNKLKLIVKSDKGTLLNETDLDINNINKIEKEVKIETYKIVKEESFFVDFFLGMKKYSLFLSMFMVILEVVLGFAILIGWKPIFTLWTTLLMILFFTFLTGYTYFTGYCANSKYLVLGLLFMLLLVISAFNYEKTWGKRLGIVTLVGILVYIFISKYTDFFFECEFTKGKMKVSDCGCFGDFIKLEPCVSFWKDIVLLTLILFLIIRRKKIVPLFSNIFSWNAMIVVSIASFMFAYLCNRYLPVWDFLPYKVGFNLNKEMEMPKGESASSIVISKYIYEKDGKIKVFDKNNLNELDSSWKFIDRKDSIIKEAWKSKYQDFDFPKRDDNSDNIKDSILKSNKPVVLIAANTLYKANPKSWIPIKKLITDCKQKGYLVYAVTSSSLEDADALANEYQLPIKFSNADNTLLKTMMRSEPGVLFFYKATVMDKWSSRSIPDIKDLEKLLQ